MRLIAAAKRVAKRYWPALSIRTILLATFVFVAALPGIGAVSLRVYENTLVQQTEAELIAQGAVLVGAYRATWGGATSVDRRLAPEPPTIDLRADRVLPFAPSPIRAGPADAHAVTVGRILAPVVNDATAVTLSSTRLLDAAGVVVAGHGDLGLSYAGVPEVRRAIGGRATTVLRTRIADPYGLHAPLEWLSRAVSIRVHHVRPVIVAGQVVGIVMLSRSPRGLFVGVYQDRGKIILGIVVIFATLLVLAALLSRGIARPIRDLTRATHDVARGQVTIPDAPTTAAVEIRELYANFALMAARIDVRTRYLRDFAAAMSHEFKTPLAGIRGVLELLADHDMTVAERSRFLGNATADADRLARLVQRLLDLARADMAVTQRARCDPHEVMRGVAQSIRALSVATRGDEGDLPVDEDTLTTVFTILMQNSVDAGATRVAIDVDIVAGPTLRYTDNGSGIASGDVDRIFEPFFTSRRGRGGTGLGLPIARSLLSASEATIDLVPSEDGAAFELSFPAR